MSENLQILYSRHKLGDINAIEFFANSLYYKITTDLKEEISSDKEKWVLVTGSYLNLKNNAFYLGEILRTNLKMNVINLSRKSYRGQLYTVSSIERKRKLAREVIHYRGSSLHGMNVIFVDDCISTGTIADAVVEILMHAGANKVYTYAIVKIDNSQIHSEIELDRKAISLNGGREIVDILKNAENPLTKRMMTFLLELHPIHFIQLLNSLSYFRKEELKEAIFKYSKS